MPGKEHPGCTPMDTQHNERQTQMSDIADKIYAATGLTLGAEAAAAIGQMIQAENEKLREALTEVMVWINEWEPAFIQDGEWRETKRMVRAALGEKE